MYMYLYAVNILIADELPDISTTNGRFGLQDEDEVDDGETTVTFTPLDVLLEHSLVRPILTQ